MTVSCNMIDNKCQIILLANQPVNYKLFTVEFHTYFQNMAFHNTKYKLYSKPEKFQVRVSKMPTQTTNKVLFVMMTYLWR